MGKALYRDYRPKSFEEVVGQQHITTTLKRAISSGKIRHAYLFTGPRGVGKTSVARILAHEVNGLPYTDDSMHLDIIEIDAASNRRIDEIRDLRDKVHITPSSAKYKVYIIDEVHMLTREAFNALLKTLEEPPEHCIFILATTESHKLPETIVSRTQRFEFKAIEPANATDHLAAIAKKEKIDIDKSALELLAEHGDGSFRDSIGLLDQFSTVTGKIDEQDVRDFLGLPDQRQVDNLVAAIDAGSMSESLNIYDQIKAAGSGSASVAKLISKNLRERLAGGSDVSWVIELLKELIEVPASSRPDELLEIAILSASAKNFKSPSEFQPAAQTVAPKTKPEPKAEAVAPPEAAPTEPEPKIDLPKPKAQPAKAFDESVWEEVLSEVKAKAASLYTALRLAEPEFTEDKLILTFEFPLHQKKLNVAENKTLILDVFHNITGKNIELEAVIGKPKLKEAPKVEKPKEPKKVDQPSELAAISNIFGSTEVIES